MTEDAIDDTLAPFISLFGGHSGDWVEVGLDGVDSVAAGWSDTMTFGGTTWLREKGYGKIATRNHNTFLFGAGQTGATILTMLVGATGVAKLLGPQLAKAFGVGTLYSRGRAKQVTIATKTQTPTVGNRL